MTSPQACISIEVSSLCSELLYPAPPGRAPEQAANDLQHQDNRRGMHWAHGPQMQGKDSFAVAATTTWQASAPLVHCVIHFTAYIALQAQGMRDQSEADLLKMVV